MPVPPRAGARYVDEAGIFGQRAALGPGIAPEPRDTDCPSITAAWARVKAPRRPRPHSSCCRCWTCSDSMGRGRPPGRNVCLPWAGPRPGRRRSAAEAGSVEWLIAKEPEVDLVPFEGVDHVEHAAGADGFLNRLFIHIEPWTWKRLENVRYLVALNGDDYVEVVGEAGFPLEARNDRSGDHVLDPGTIEGTDYMRQ